MLKAAGITMKFRTHVPSMLLLWSAAAPRCTYSFLAKNNNAAMIHRMQQPALQLSSTRSSSTAAIVDPVVENKSKFADQKFADLAISAESRRALAEVFQYEFMTPVQAETLPAILQGEDCLAKAKTGTGKTLGFLIPTIERILQSNNNNNNNDKPKQQICSLILSPTRELAFQITREAESMLQFHKDLNVVSLVGGSNKNTDLRNLQRSGGVSMVVATPGRLLDLLEHDGLAARMSNLNVLVLDEADNLLDMGFRPTIEKILRLIDASSKSRQTLLFSATVPESVEEIAGLALRPKYRFVDTVGADTDQTHLHVKQELIVTPQKDQFAAMASILHQQTIGRQQQDGKPFKVIVFFTTARLTGFCADFFRKANPGYQIVDIHSRKSQSARQTASEIFRTAENAVLFSSDVSARGMDYPDVTFVLQQGLTDRSQYIHRLGRTARAGKEGKGALLLATYEERHMRKELSDMPLELVAAPPLSPAIAELVKSGRQAVSTNEEMEVAAQQAYKAMLGYYKGNLRKCGWDSAGLVATANMWAKEVGLVEQPRLEAKTIGKMGLKGVPGLLIQKNPGGSAPPRNNSGSDRRQPRNNNSGGPSRSNSDSEGPRRQPRANNPGGPSRTNNNNPGGSPRRQAQSNSNNNR
jgi:ATP-dependent RNA helicase MSS116